MSMLRAWGVVVWHCIVFGIRFSAAFVSFDGSYVYVGMHILWGSLGVLQIPGFGFSCLIILVL